jgi:hypothetical protein
MLEMVACTTRHFFGREYYLDHFELGCEVYVDFECSVFAA